MFYKTDTRLMQVKSIAECSRGAFCNTFDCTKLLHVFKTFVLSIFEWPLKSGFTVNVYFCGSAFESTVHLSLAQ